MTPFQVELTVEAENNLAGIWLDAEDRLAVNTADAAIHNLLVSDPLGRGQLVAEELYKISYAPLVMLYSVDRARQYVEVCKVALLQVPK